MDLVIFIEKGLFVFAEALWVAYLIFAVVFYFAKFVPGRLALKRFQRLRKLHRRIFLPVLCLFVFYELTPYGSLIGRKNGYAGDICRRRKNGFLWYCLPEQGFGTNRLSPLLLGRIYAERR